MSDIRKDLFKKVRNIGETQQKVVFQQKKPLLNYEINLSQDISNEKISNLSKLSIGNSYSGDSFKVSSGAVNSITINKGIFYHKGFPIVLEEDVFVSLASPEVGRTDTVYVEWGVTEVNGSEYPEIKDSSLGIETTRQHRITSLIKVSEGIDPVPTPLTISFSGLDITLESDDLKVSFPDWLRIPGTKFITSSLNNVGVFEISSYSEELRTITLVTGSTLVTESLDNVKFYEYDPLWPNSRQKEFTAYRKNYFNIAKILRTDESISDERDKVSYTFVKSGCSVTRLSTTSVSVSEGDVFVGDVNFNIEPGTILTVGTELTNNSLNYVYINDLGYIECSISEPTVHHLMLAEVKVKSGKIWGIEDPSLLSETYLKAIDDIRDFFPISWKYKYSSGGSDTSGVTSLKFRADQNISSFNIVYVSSSDGVSVSNSSFTTYKKVPSIGLTTKDIPQNEIGNIVVMGEVENPSWNFTPGATLYAGIGVVTQTPPVLTGTYVQRLGIALTNTKIFIKPDIVFIKNNESSVFDYESSLVSLRNTGDLEVIGYDTKINTDKSSYLAPIATSLSSSIATTFKILPGRFFIKDTESFYFSGFTVGMGIGGSHQTSAMPINYYNKAFFTVDESLVIKKYEGISNSVLSSVESPEIPDNEIPICIVSYREKASGLAGDIQPINQINIEDKRNWINLGNLDGTSFKPVYRNDTQFIIQKGSGWFNECPTPITLENNEIISTSPSVSADYKIYLDFQNASGGTATSSDFVAILSNVPVDNRRYIPLGEYSTASSKITRNTFKAYSSKFWKFRDKPYASEQTFTTTFPVSSFTLTEFTFLNSDYLDIKINGIKIYDEDFTKSEPFSVTTNYPIKKGAKVKIRKV